jgi:Xaa-Pro dipeptidase
VLDIYLHPKKNSFLSNNKIVDPMMLKQNLFLKTIFVLAIMLSSTVLFSQSEVTPSMIELSKLSDEEWSNQIRNEKFDIALPNAMRKNGVDMWIHVLREAKSQANPDLFGDEDDPFGPQDLGVSSGLVVFSDRGESRIERAVLGRRWGATQRQREGDKSGQVKELGIYDVISKAVFVGEPISDPMTEYDYRFKGLREFVEARDPKVIAVNYRENLGPWETTRRINDGISFTDYRLLVKELGPKYADRIVSSEYVIMDYSIAPVPSEVKQLYKMRKDELKLVEKAFANIVPGVTRIDEVGETGDYEVDVTVFRRMKTGQSQRTRSAGWEDAVIEGGDIVAAPSQGVFGYVLREGETEPPVEVQKIWNEYLKIDAIFAKNIKAGIPSRVIIENYTKDFEAAGISVVGPQLHMAKPKNNLPVYAEGFPKGNTLISVDCHGKGKGARFTKHDIYLGPRIGSYGPDWTHDVTLADNHHFVFEYFFYMPSPTNNPEEDQYLFFWNHEQAIASKDGAIYLSEPQKQLIIIK